MVLGKLIVVLGLIAVGSCLECLNIVRECRKSVGEQCNYGYSSIDKVIGVCSYGMYCNGNSLTCQANIPVGGNCEYTYYGTVQNAHCVENAFCMQINGTSICLNRNDIPNSKPGDSCTSDTQCVFPAFGRSQDRNSTCVNGRCYGVPEGDFCDGFYQCLPGLYCDIAYNYYGGFSGNGTCTKLKIKGEKCTFRGIPVVLDSQCGDQNGCLQTSPFSDRICAPLWQGSLGDYCNASDQNYYCGSGYDCDAKSSTCTEWVFSSLKPCSSNDDCTKPGETCTCSYNDDGTSFCSNGHSSREQYEIKACTYKHNCTDYLCKECSKQFCGAFSSISEYKLCDLPAEYSVRINECKHKAEATNTMSTAIAVFVLLGVVVAIIMGIVQYIRYKRDVNRIKYSQLSTALEEN